MLKATLQLQPRKCDDCTFYAVLAYASDHGEVYASAAEECDAAIGRMQNWSSCRPGYLFPRLEHALMACEALMTEAEAESVAGKSRLGGFRKMLVGQFEFNGGYWAQLVSGNLLQAGGGLPGCPAWTCAMPLPAGHCKMQLNYGTAVVTLLAAESREIAYAGNAGWQG
jgi:hypothetical protein